MQPLVIHVQVVEPFFGLFNDISSLELIASNDRMIREYWSGEDVEGSGHGLLGVGFLRLPGRTKASHEQLLSGYSVSQLTFKSDSTTFWIQVRIVTASANLLKADHLPWESRIFFLQALEEWAGVPSFYNRSKLRSVNSCPKIMIWTCESNLLLI